MKPRYDWHKTPLGRAILFFGSIKFAVPILVLATLALCYGTWLEATTNATHAKIVVYGSWWFVVLMALICVTLILAVVTRYPWRKKHTGFIIVHAALITIIVSGFVTFFTKVEGTMSLEEGMRADALRGQTNELQILTHNAGEFEILDAQIIRAPGTISLNGIEIEVLERWDNSAQETVVLNDGMNPLHAIELKFGAGDEGHWIGQLQNGETPPVLHEVEVRVLPQGQAWSPETIGQQSRPVFRHRNKEGLIDLEEVGQVVDTGWAIESIRRFKHAMVGPEGMIEGDESRDNPAVEVTLVHEDGSRERHAAFDRFRGSINKKQVDGEDFSELVLEYVGHGLDRPTLVFTRDELATTAHFASPDGHRIEQVLDGQAPWTIDLGDGSECIILEAFSNARGTTKLVKAPQGEENMPALVVRIHGTAADGTASHEPMILAWGARSMIQVGDEFLGISYTPSMTRVPFAIELVDFRKVDYPGSSMAMAYESDVIFTDEHGNTHEQTIWMNNPLEYQGWKVYQSGFVGSDVSIFQVTKDPGLLATYIGCIFLCLGILVMYYSKAYSHGHPGMPKVFDSKKKRSSNHAFAERTSDVVDGDRHDLPPSTSVATASPGSGLEVQVCIDSDPGSRTHDADGHLRKTRGRRDHRTHTVG